LRARSESNRQKQEHKEELSRIICQRLVELAEYGPSGTVLNYVSGPAEVQTAALISRARADRKRIVVPCCVSNELELFRLESMDDLAPRTLGILEPRADVRADPERRIDVAQVDLIVVPGVAFDRRCGRLGHGRGYYDRLLARARHDTFFVGVAFECQVFEQVPMLPYDVFMDVVVTEKTTYRPGTP
jgi:5-formyltetrahydrofolate cyclo-ligase